MKTLVIVLSFLSSLIGFGQKNQISVIKSEKILGKNFLDSSDIKGFEYAFSDRIEETFLDTTTGLLTTKLRGLTKNGKWLNSTGYIVQYDIKNETVLWNKKFSYQTSDLKQFNNTMIYTISNKSYCLNVHTGSEIWEVKNNIYLVDPIDQIGIGYKFKTMDGYSDELEGIDLKNGQVVWKRNLNREYGWNDVFYANDSILVVVASGLHALNIKTGQGWDYNTITGKKDYKGTAVKNAFGVGLGLLTGTSVLSIGHDVVRDLVSNKLTDSSHIYIASKEQVAKINKTTGEMVWSYPFSKNEASKSSIFMNDSLVFMINKGMAFMGNKQLNFGKPFFAAFSKQSGEKHFLTIINTTDDPILSYHRQNTFTYLIFKNRIEKYETTTGNLICKKDFPEENYGDLKYFIGDQVYIKNPNGDLTCLKQSDSTNVYVYTSQKKTLALDPELNISKTIDYNDLNIYYLSTKNYKFFAKDNKTLVVNNNGHQIAEIYTSSSAFTKGNTLYDTQDNKLIAIDLIDNLKN